MIVDRYTREIVIFNVASPFSSLVICRQNTQSSIDHIYVPGDILLLTLLSSQLNVFAQQAIFPLESKIHIETNNYLSQGMYRSWEVARCLIKLVKVHIRRVEF